MNVAKIRAIAQAYAQGEGSYYVLARRFEVGDQAIRNICEGRTWKGVVDPLVLHECSKVREAARCGPKLTPEDINNIREDWAEREKTKSQLAEEYGVSRTRIYQIVG